MIKEKRYLITTADEKTWKLDKPVIFLGEWCRLYKRKQKWLQLDSLVAKPYGLGVNKKNNDYLTIVQIEQKIFPEICEILNQHFNSRYDIRFWKIVLGPWFRIALEILLNRTNTLKQCLELYEISGTTVYKNDNSILTTLNLDETRLASDDDKWNNVLNARILDYLAQDLPRELIKNESVRKINSSYKFSASNNSGFFKSNFSNIIFKVYLKIARRFIKDNDAFIINSYLPTKEEIKLELALGQWPQLWKINRSHLDFSKVYKEPDKLLRDQLSKKINFKSKDDFENIVRSLVFELLPICYLEGFREVEKIANQQIWPKFPKFIFTSINFDGDEVFKLWTALKINSGIKYYVGQHGNNYGTLKNYTPRIEEFTSDKFISWGYKNEMPQYTPAFLFKTVGIKKKNYNSKGGLLLIEIHPYSRRRTSDATSEYIDYFDDQKEFVRNLNKIPKEKLTIRLHQAHQIFEWDEKSRWFDFDNSIKLDTGKQDIRQLISQSRLIVHSYDSTGLLETLFQNIPTLAFWQNGFDHLENSAKPFYQKLVDAGIVHLSAKSASDKINVIWGDVDSWWSQTNVQEARKQFCECYARESQNPIYELKKILNS